MTRQLHIPDEDSDHESKSPPFTSTLTQSYLHQSDAWPLPPSQLPRPQLPKSKVSEQSVYTSIRNSNPYAEDARKGSEDGSQRPSIESERAKDPIWSPMGAPSAIPHPLKKGATKRDGSMPGAMVQAKKSYSDVRHPSYEGNGYQEEISLTNLHTRNISTGGQSVASDKLSSKSRGRLPAPIKVPPPHVGQLRVALNDTYHNDTSYKLNTSVPLRHESAPKPVAWPGFEDSPPRPSKAASAFAPPIPAKSPERLASKRDQRSEQLLREETGARDVMRIVSKENIRAALGNLTPESSLEDLRAQALRAKKVPSRIASPPRLETYNSHMFPRKDASAQGDSGR